MSRPMFVRMGLALVCLLVLAIALLPVATAAEGDDSAEFEPAGFAIFGTICLTICVLFLVIAIFIAVWIYKDAEKRGKSGAMWVIILLLGTLILSLLGTIIVIVIWIMVRPPIVEHFGPGPYRDGPPPRDYDRDYPPPPGYDDRRRPPPRR